MCGSSGPSCNMPHGTYQHDNSSPPLEPAMLGHLPGQRPRGNAAPAAALMQLPVRPADEDRRFRAVAPSRAWAPRHRYLSHHWSPTPTPAALQVTADAKFVDLGADSLDTVEIMMALEEKVREGRVLAAAACCWPRRGLQD